MAMLNFDATNVEPTQSFELMPIHWTVAIITDSEIKQTKAGNGSYLQLTFEIQGGEFNARKLWARLNLDSQNPVAVEIAQAELSSICHATGVVQVQDSAMLHNLPIDIKIGLEKPREGFEQRNEIKEYAPLGKHTQSAAPTQQPTQPQQPPAATYQQPPTQPQQPPAAPTQPAAPQSPAYQPPTQPAPTQPATDLKPSWAT